jgi:hypothetical protein
MLAKRSGFKRSVQVTLHHSQHQALTPHPAVLAFPIPGDRLYTRLSNASIHQIP